MARVRQFALRGQSSAVCFPWTESGHLHSVARVRPFALRSQSSAISSPWTEFGHLLVEFGNQMAELCGHGKQIAELWPRRANCFPWPEVGHNGCGEKWIIIFVFIIYYYSFVLFILSLFVLFRKGVSARLVRVNTLSVQRPQSHKPVNPWIYRRKNE